MRQFAKSHTVWEAAVDAVAELDAMMSLACAADVFSVYGPMCRPRLIEARSKQQVRNHPEYGFGVCKLGTYTRVIAVATRMMRTEE